MALPGMSGWSRDDRVTASAKLTRETVASVRAVCDLNAHRASGAANHGRMALAHGAPSGPVSIWRPRVSLIRPSPDHPATSRIDART